MARALRPEVPDGIYHAWNRGVNRADIVSDDRDRQLFLDLLQEVIRRFGWIIHEFMLMTNHFHLIFSTPDPTPSRGMKWLEQKFAEHINRRYERVGPLYQGRFKAQLVESGSYLLTLLRYVALNPVRAGMVERPEEYRWSSYRWLAGFEKAPSGSSRERFSRRAVPISPRSSTSSANSPTPGWGSRERRGSMPSGRSSSEASSGLSRCGA